MGLLKTIFILVIAWWIFRFLDRWLANKVRPQGPSRNGNATTKKQDVIINYDPRKTKSSVRDDAGEVVDFEEIE